MYQSVSPIVTQPITRSISEFGQYDRSVVSDVILEHAEKNSGLWRADITAGKERFIYDVLHGFAQKYRVDSSAKEDYWLNPYSCLAGMFTGGRIMYLDDEGKVKSETVSVLVKPLYQAYQALVSEYNTCDTKRISLGTAKACVRSYFELVQKTVFFKNNNNLRNIQFRSSEYLSQLVLPQYSDRLIKKDDPDLGYLVPFADAFCLQALLNIADRLENCMARLEPNDATRRLRIHEECTLADMDFGRFMWMKGQSYRITMNRQSSKIVARPFYRKSSITSVKPLRLYEKIKAFIANNWENNQKFEITIVGHCERSCINEKPKETELIDLCAMLDGWLDEQKTIYGKEEVPNVHIRYLLNKADWFDCNAKRRFDEDNSGGIHFLSQDKEYCEQMTAHSVSCTVEYVDYEKQFAYTSENLLCIINESNVVFLLEPSFLFFENYDIYRHDSIDYYCERVRKHLAQKNDITWAMDDMEPESAYGSMQFLSAQLNRIMASRSMDAGDICRTVNKQYVNEIITAVKKKKKRTCVFLFSSETVGLDMSGMAVYPLSRVEEYNQKGMTIFQFCNYPVPSLLCAHQALEPDKPASYQIALWSLMKYASIRCALIDRDAWKGSGDSFRWLKPYDHFRIYKSILINVNATPKRNGLFKIDVTLTMKPCFAKYLFVRMKDEGIPEENRLGIAESLYETLLNFYFPFISKLFSEVLFVWNPDEFSDDCGGIKEENYLMREGFAMNMYSAATNTHDMFFLYLYKKELFLGQSVFRSESSAWRGEAFILTDERPAVKNDLKRAKEELVNQWNDNPISASSGQSDFFMDKKLFMEIPKHLHRRGELDMVGVNMCIEANARGIYNLSKSAGIDYYYDFAVTLLDLCKWADTIDDDLYVKLKAWKNSLY